MLTVGRGEAIDCYCACLEHWSIFKQIFTVTLSAEDIDTKLFIHIKDNTEGVVLQSK